MPAPRARGNSARGRSAPSNVGAEFPEANPVRTDTCYVPRRPDSPPTRAAARARTPRRRCRRAGRRSAANRAGTVAIVKLARIDVVELVPRDRRRHRSVPVARAPSRRWRSCGRGRSGCSRRTPCRVAGPCATRSSSRRPGSAARPRARTPARPAHLAEAPARLDPHVDVQPVAARGLRPADRAELVEHLVGDVRHAADRVEARTPASGRGRSATRRASRRRRGGSSRDGTRPSTSARPRSRCPARSRTARRRSGRSAGSRPPPSRPSPARPCGSRFWCTFSPSTPVREAVQHARPLAQRADDPVADAHVVLGEVELGLAAGREVDAVRARDPHGPARPTSSSTAGLLCLVVTVIGRLDRGGRRRISSHARSAAVVARPARRCAGRPPSARATRPRCARRRSTAARRGRLSVSVSIGDVADARRVRAARPRIVVPGREQEPCRVERQVGRSRPSAVSQRSGPRAHLERLERAWRPGERRDERRRLAVRAQLGVAPVALRHRQRRARRRRRAAAHEQLGGLAVAHRARGRCRGRERRVERDRAEHRRRAPRSPRRRRPPRACPRRTRTSPSPQATAAPGRSGGPRSPSAAASSRAMRSLPPSTV